MIKVAEAQQPFAQMPAVCQGEVADASDLVRWQAVLNMAFGDSRMPVTVAVKVSGQRPDRVHGRLDNVADVYFGLDA